MDNICTHQDCELEKYKEYDKCVLHCEKHDYKTDNESGLLKEFYDVFVEYCRNILVPNSTDEAVYDEIEQYLKMTATEKINASTSIYTRRQGLSKGITFDRIKFPDRKKGDVFDFFSILRSFDSIHFSGCHFNFSKIEDLDNIGFFFKVCEFKNDWYLTPILIANNLLGFLYQTCTFHKGVTNDNPQLQIKGRSIIEGNIFYLCKFHENIAFYGVEFNGLLFSKQSTERDQIKLIEFNNCELKDKLYLNSFNIGKFVSQDSIFIKKFEFKKNKVYDFEIINSNFLEVTDFFKSYFTYFEITRSIFEDFVGFELCIFGIEVDEIEHKNIKEGSQKAKFNYTTFKKNNNFRDTVFLKGLDLRNINPNQQPNFLGTYINPTNTNRETFRIVKHSFDSIGNYIEANKFFKHEMEKYRIELKDKKWHFGEKFVFIVNKISSNYGQFFWLPILWIFFIMYLHKLTADAYKSNDLYTFVFANNFNLNDKILWLNDLANRLIPVNKFLDPGFEFLSLFFYVIYVVLIYQTVVALKRLTKR